MLVPRLKLNSRLFDYLHIAGRIWRATKATSRWRPKHAPKVLGRAKIDPGSAAAIRLLILTGARLREILHAKWEDVDLERGILVVHGKTGRRSVVLSGPAKAILAALPCRDVYIFPGGAAGKPRADLNRPWRAVRRRAKLEGVRLHDLRHS